MAVFAGAHIIGNYEYMFWIDTNRYRCTIWEKKRPTDEFYAKHVKTMVDKDDARLRTRVKEWAAQQGRAPDAAIASDNPK